MKLGFLEEPTLSEAIDFIGESTKAEVSVYSDGTIAFGDMSANDRHGLLEGLSSNGIYLVAESPNCYRIASIIDEAIQDTIDPNDIDAIDELGAKKPIDMMRDAILAKIAKEEDPDKVHEMLAKLDAPDATMKKLLGDPDVRKKAVASAIERIRAMDEEELAALGDPNAS